MQNIISFLDVENYIAATYAGKRCAVKPFYIPFDFGDFLDTGGTSTVQQRIPSNADFLLMRMSYSASSVDFGNILRVQFVDGGTNEQFYASPVPIFDVCDTNILGMRDQSVYRRLAGSSVISGTMTSTGNGTAVDNAIITMAGVLVYVYSA